MEQYLELMMPFYHIEEPILTLAVFDLSRLYNIGFGMAKIRIWTFGNSWASGVKLQDV